MGTIIINGQRFVSNNVEVRNGKVKIDGIAQDGNLHGDAEARVTEVVVGRSRSVATVKCGAARGTDGAIQAVAVSCGGNGLRSWTKR